jgi:hypothetical protein
MMPTMEGSEASNPPKVTQVSVVWPSDDSLPDVLAANQFAVQILGGEPGRSDEIVIAVGHVAAPILTGTPNEQEAQLAAVDELTVRPFARFVVTRHRLGELLVLLQGAAARWDREHGQADEGRTS